MIAMIVAAGTSGIAIQSPHASRVGAPFFSTGLQAKGEGTVLGFDSLTLRL